MLTGDLARADVRKGVIRPRWVDVKQPGLLEVARELVEVFEQHVGRSRGELHEALEGLFGDSTRVILYRGLVKLLTDRATFETAAAVDPIEVRRRLFERAAAEGPVSLSGWRPAPAGAESHGSAGTRVAEGRGAPREVLVAAVAADLGVSPEEIEQAFHADLKDEQRMTAFEALEPEALLHRYNTALAQAVLLKATELELTVSGQTPARYRALFRAMRFFGLIHRVHRDGDSFRIALDGPMSLFRLSQKYGVQMATFLPVVLHMTEGWSLRATIQWSERVRATLALGPEDGLVGHYKDRGTWQSEEERWFVDRFRELDTPWTLDEDPGIVDLGGGDVFVPDYGLCHPDGRAALLEIVWFWRRASLEPRLASLAGGAAPNAILAVSDRLRASKEDLVTQGIALHRFKGVLLPKPVIALAEQVATTAGGRRVKAKKATPRARKKGAAAP